ncbi:Uncharacterised protein [Enterobacter cloacae]|nr:Uncharacterised protein [Enterobacter cloacae]VAM09384.1 Uncharacterised protein [Enterobacter kobei]
MNTENNFAHLYSELSLSPDLPTLAKRCTLLTEILLDCKSLPQTQPVCRCLGAYLEEVKTGLTESMRDFQVSVMVICSPHPLREYFPPTG